MSDHDCRNVLARVHEFLDHELSEDDADHIRAHLQACEPCMDEFDIQQAMKSLVKRSCTADPAPQELRAKIHDLLTRFAAQG